MRQSILYAWLIEHWKAAKYDTTPPLVVSPKNPFTCQKVTKYSNVHPLMRTSNYTRSLVRIYPSTQPLNTTIIKVPFVRSHKYCRRPTIYTTTCAWRWREATRWVIGIYSASSMMMIHRTKLVYFVTTEVCTGGQTEFMWFWHLGLDRLELQINWGSFPLKQFR